MITTKEQPITKVLLQVGLEVGGIGVNGKNCVASPCF